MSKVIDIYEFIDKIAPFEKQESWDNSGFLIGESEKNVKKALVCLDCKAQTIDEAVNLGCELIISHHPIIFAAQKTLTDNSIPYLAAKNGIAVISAHTSYDVAEDGVSDILAKALGCENIRKAPLGIYTLGDTDEITAKEFANTVKEKLQANVSYCLGNKIIKTVAFCGGAGSDYIYDAISNGADAFVTGEGKYHEFLDAEHLGIALITAGHFETEVIAMKPLMEKLQNEFNDIEFMLSNEKPTIKHI